MAFRADRPSSGLAAEGMSDVEIGAGLRRNALAGKATSRVDRTRKSADPVTFMDRVVEGQAAFQRDWQSSNHERF